MDTQTKVDIHIETIKMLEEISFDVKRALTLSGEHSEYKYVKLYLEDLSSFAVGLYQSQVLAMKDLTNSTDFNINGFAQENLPLLKKLEKVLIGYRFRGRNIVEGYYGEYTAYFSKDSEAIWDRKYLEDVFSHLEKECKKAHNFIIRQEVRTALSF